MKARNMIVCGGLVLSSFLNGMPNQLKKEVQKAQNCLSKLSSTDLTPEKIQDVRNVLEKVCVHLQEEYEKVKVAIDSSYDDAPKHIRRLKTDLSFLKDLSLYMQSSNEENAQKLKIWVNCNYKFASLVDKALSSPR